jgi:cytochrome c-type biogenesis protein CcmH/NrfG
VPGNIHSKSLEMLGEIYLEQKNPEQAIAAFQTLLEKYEEDRPLASYRYKLGQIHFEQGSIQKAADAWSGFKGEKTSFWRNLAQEQLKNSSWRDEYKKYIKRIPAMSESAQGK